MAFILLDHNVARDIAPLLRQAGHGAITALDAGMHSAEDDEYVLVSSDRAWTIVTHNKKDFNLLHGAWRRWSTAWGIQHAHAGILVLGEAAPTILANAIIDLLAGDPPLRNHLYQWRPGRAWARGR